MDAPNRRVVLVACQIMEPELERLRAERPHVEVRYLEQSLHRTPQKMPERVQAVVDEAADRRRAHRARLRPVLERHLGSPRAAARS